MHRCFVTHISSGGRLAQQTDACAGSKFNLVELDDAEHLTHLGASLAEIDDRHLVCSSSESLVISCEISLGSDNINFLICRAIAWQQLMMMMRIWTIRWCKISILVGAS